jgi:hypothetical protein
MKEPLRVEIDGKVITYNGYAFIDECGDTIIIVYGENRRDAMSEYLNSNSDPLGIKYKIVKLWQKQK